MAKLFTPILEGDGIDFSFFNSLWNKNRTEKSYDKLGQDRNVSDNENLALRIPDTVVFQLGQPLKWYFTSERDKRPLILRKRKQNLSAVKIEEEFIRKARVGGKSIDKNDIVAYFIAAERKSKDAKDGKKSDEEDDFGFIEYLNEEGLRKKLSDLLRLSELK